MEGYDKPEEAVTIVMAPDFQTKAIVFRVYLEKEVQAEERKTLSHLCRVCKTDSAENIAKGTIFLGCCGKNTIYFTLRKALLLLGLGLCLESVESSTNCTRTRCAFATQSTFIINSLSY